MGEYIKTGIIAEFRIYKSGIPQMDTNADKTRSELAAGVVDNTASFDWEDKGDRFVWRLKQDIIGKYLPIFLKRYFSDFCDRDKKYYDSHCKAILDYLSTNPSADKLHEWDEDSDYEITFDRDEERCIYIAESKVGVNIYNITLTSEGKVMYEKMDGHLKFFESAMRKAYADDPLGGCLMVTIW